MMRTSSKPTASYDNVLNFMLLQVETLPCKQDTAQPIHDFSQLLAMLRLEKYHRLWCLHYGVCAP